jgi:hypothetical protein
MLKLISIGVIEVGEVLIVTVCGITNNVFGFTA